MKKVLKVRNDIVFFIKLYPLRTHPEAYKKSKAIVCAKSVRLLEKAYDRKELPDPTCETVEVDNNIELAQNLGINGTPAIILPDGAIVSGTMDADSLEQLIDAAGESIGIYPVREEEPEEDASEGGEEKPKEATNPSPG